MGRFYCIFVYRFHIGCDFIYNDGHRSDSGSDGTYCAKIMDIRNA